MNRQKELPGMPEMDALAKQACEYLNIKGVSDKVKHDLEKAKAQLALEFIKSGKTSIKISGYIVSYAHKESESITAKEAV
jgi:hypothetical protein